MWSSVLCVFVCFVCFHLCIVTFVVSPIFMNSIAVSQQYYSHVSFPRNINSKLVNCDVTFRWVARVNDW